MDLFKEEQAHLKALPSLPYDIATVKTLRASRQFRIILGTNRYSVPAEYASTRVTLKAYPDRVCIYHQRSSSPATCAATTGTKTSKTPIIPAYCLSNAVTLGSRNSWIALFDLLASRGLDFTFHDIKAKSISDYEGDKQRFSGVVYDRKIEVVDSLDPDQK